jgi:hypothetical protein
MPGSVSITRGMGTPHPSTRPPPEVRPEPARVEGEGVLQRHAVRVRRRLGDRPLPRPFSRSECTSCRQVPAVSNRSSNGSEMLHNGSVTRPTANVGGARRMAARSLPFSLSAAPSPAADQDLAGGEHEQRHGRSGRSARRCRPVPARGRPEPRGPDRRPRPRGGHALTHSAGRAAPHPRHATGNGPHRPTAVGAARADGPTGARVLRAGPRAGARGAHRRQPRPAADRRPPGRALGRRSARRVPGLATCPAQGPVDVGRARLAPPHRDVGRRSEGRVPGLGRTVRPPPGIPPGRPRGAAGDAQHPDDPLRDAVARRAQASSPRARTGRAAGDPARS